MAINTCIVSGSVKNLLNQAVTNVTIRARLTTPFFHTDGTFIPNYEVTTTTDSDGAWSLTLIETATVSRTITIVIEYPGGTQDRLKREFTVTIPNQASANFDDLVTE